MDNQATRPSDTPPLALGVEDAARTIGISRSAMYELLAGGAVRSFKQGRRRLVPVAALEDYITQQMDAAGDRL